MRGSHMNKILHSAFSASVKMLIAVGRDEWLYLCCQVTVKDWKITVRLLE